MIQNSLKIAHFLLMMVLLLVVNSQTCTQSCQGVTYSTNTCWMCYNSCSPPQQQYSINTCQLKYCKWYFGGSCFYYDYRFITTKSCMNQCCGVVKSTGQAFTSKQIAKCVGIQINQIIPNNIQQSGNNSTIYIIIGSCIGVGMIVFLIVFCFCKQRIKSFFCGQDNQSSEERVQSVYQQKQDYTIKTMIIDSQIDLKYSLEQACSICLSSQTNIKTGCGHWFHFKCMSEWLNKNFKCPNCVNQQVSPISIVCNKCSKMCFKIYLKRKTKWNKLKASAQNCICQKCLKPLQLNK